MKGPRAVSEDGTAGMAESAHSCISVALTALYKEALEGTFFPAVGRTPDDISVLALKDGESF